MLLEILGRAARGTAGGRRFPLPGTARAKPADVRLLRRSHRPFEDLAWLACYLTSGKHLAFYGSFGTVLVLLAVTAPIALAFGFAGAIAARSPFATAQMAW